MDKKIIKLDLLVEMANQFKHNRVRPLEPVVLKVASAFIKFRHAQIKETLSTLFNYTVSDDELLLLQKKCIEIKPETPLGSLPPTTNELVYDSFWMLSDSDRNKVFVSMEVEELRRILNGIQYNDNSLLQKMLVDVVNGITYDITTMSIDELVILHSVSKYLKDTAIMLPAEGQIIGQIKQLEFLRPFQNLIENFKGREAELNRLFVYVDWYEKGSVFSRAEGIFRKSVNWHDKPPLIINGIGGIGKSTLIAKFIVNNLIERKGKRLPFLYFDFDQPGLSISDPLMIITNALVQLCFQFPNSKDYIEHIRNEINEGFKENEFAISAAASLLKYERYFYAFQESSYFNEPVLVVFDSFEELQYRASATELNNFYVFLQEINRYIPRLRLVFVGRSEMSNISQYTFQSLELNEFDLDAAEGFLTSIGIEEPELQKLIYERYGGNPLTLRLAGEYAKKDKTEFVAEIAYPNEGSKKQSVDKNIIQAVLVQRNLRHVHDARLKKIAIPGILVRRITAEVIQRILAVPCGLGEITIDDAASLFEELKKEKFLITETTTGYSFRQDLRIALKDMITRLEEYKDNEIHDRAVLFYENQLTLEDRAEYLYHRLIRGDDVSIIKSYYNPELRDYIENSIREFPADARAALAVVMGTAISNTTILNSSLVIWEEYCIRNIQESLKYGEQESLVSIRSVLQKRKERSKNSALIYWEAVVYERLGELTTAADIVQHALNIWDDGDYIEKGKLHLLLSEIYEYDKKYLQAYSTAEPYYHSMQKDDPGDAELELFFNFLFSLVRICKRLDMVQEAQEIIKNLSENYDIEVLSKKCYPFLPLPYRLFYKNNDSLIGFLHKLFYSFYTETKFQDTELLLRKDIQDKNEMEAFLRRRYQRSLKEISRPGSLAISMQDVLRFAECDSSQFRSTARKKLIICCDGVWDKVSSMDRGQFVTSNVDKLYHLISLKDGSDFVQLKFYDNSPYRFGSYNKLIGGVSGAELSKSIKDGYIFLSLNYAPGDEIYLFGFSRGAYVARSIAGMVRTCGIVKPEYLALVDKAYDLYKDRNSYTNPESEMMVAFRNQYSESARIKFIGVWETVGTLGIPLPWYKFMSRRKYMFHDVTLSGHIDYAYQALALDERRILFTPCLWQKSDAATDSDNPQVLEQRWFAGVHGNVGGGYSDSGLSDIALQWMISKAREVGLGFSRDVNSLKPNMVGEIRNTYTPLFWFWLPKWRRVNLNTNTCETIDSSVFERAKEMPSYKPINLLEYVSKTEPIPVDNS